MAIATGYVLELTSSTITVNLERNLQKKYKEQTFIIDKYNSQSGDVFNFTTLGLLIEPGERSTFLRRIVTERVPPTYMKNLPKIIETEGYVLELTSSTITVNLERNLQKKYKEQTFIIDKYNSQSGDVFNFTTLGLLIEPGERSTFLRRIVTERVPPTYMKNLPKIIETEGGPIMEHLNSVQRLAVVNALTTESYMLIKGLPGTGKFHLQIFQYY